MSEPARKLVFVGGCARSGTTALYVLLNAHRQTLIGNERYGRKWRTRSIAPRHFEHARFLEIRDDDTHKSPTVRGQFDDLPAAKRNGSYEVTGDKYPMLHRVYDHVWETFPDSRVVFIVRDPRRVAISYQNRADDTSDHLFRRGGYTAIKEWNESARATVAALEQGRPIIVVGFERIFASHSAVRRLFAALDLDPDDVEPGVLDALLARSRQLEKPLPVHLTSKAGLVRSYAGLMADWKSYSTLLDDHCILSDMSGTLHPSRGVRSVPTSAADRGTL